MIASDARAQPRCVGAILMRWCSHPASFAENLSKERAWVHAMCRVVRAGIDATRLFQVRAKIAGRGFLFDDGFLPPHLLGIVGHHFEGMKVDVAVGTITRAKAAADAPVFDDHFERMAAADGADR